MRHTDASAKDTVLVGDTKSDYMGDLKTKVDFIGVTYGFGFNLNTSKKMSIRTVNNVEELLNLIIKDS